MAASSSSSRSSATELSIGTLATFHSTAKLGWHTKAKPLQHPIGLKMPMQCWHLLHMLEGHEHLSEGMISTGPSPRLLDHPNVLWLSNQRAESIGGPKEMYGMIEVLQSMLAGQWDCCMYPSLNKGRTQLVKSLYRFPKAFKRGWVNSISTGNVTSIHECSDRADHHRWDVSRNCRKKNLEDMVSIPILRRWYRCTYLHQCLRVITCPLLIIAPIWEPAKTREGGDSRDPRMRLLYDLWSKKKRKEKSYWWSMSSIISDNFFSPCVACRYSSTQLTRCSLNTPLINWWRRSGARSSCMSAHGNVYVNGCSIPYETKSHQKSVQYIPQYHVEHQNRPRECVG